MSAVEIFSLIAAIINVTETIITAFDEIKDREGLPRAFNEVNKRLPLVKKTLQAAKYLAKNTPDDEAQALEILLDGCKIKVDQLLDTFTQMAQSRHKSAASVYQIIIVNVGKMGRVETLMGHILEDVKTLATYRVFRKATEGQMQELKRAIKELAQVEPSLPDSVFDEKASGVNHYGHGDIYSNPGAGTMKHFTGNNYEAQGSMYFGMMPEHIK